LKSKLSLLPLGIPGTNSVYFPVGSFDLEKQISDGAHIDFKAGLHRAVSSSRDSALVRIVGN
jgi:hypothetical protein